MLKILLKLVTGNPDALTSLNGANTHHHTNNPPGTPDEPLKGDETHTPPPK